MNTEKYFFNYDQYMRDQHIANTTAPAPSEDEMKRYAEKVARELRFLDPEAIASEILPHATWNAARRTLDFSGKALHTHLRRLAERQPELLRPPKITARLHLEVA